MNKQPVYYLQTDPKWKNLPYRVKGESSTIGGSGCGPTSAAMLIETITGKKCTPVDTCNWSVAHGYKALNQGTYYGYFTPQFKAYGINCWQLSWTNTYHNPKSSIHDEAFNYVKKGYYLIALMKKGTWTSGGHFVVVWGVDDKIRINDPASTKTNRLNGDPWTFRNEVAYYWVIDPSSYKNNKPEEEEEIVTQADFDKMMATYLANQAKKGTTYEEETKAMEWAVDTGLIKGNENGETKPKSFLTRGEFVQVLKRLEEKS